MDSVSNQEEAVSAANSTAVETGAQEQEKAAVTHGAEQLYRTLFDISPQIVWYGQADGHITFVNQHWLEFSGFTFEESLGDGWATAIDPTHRQRLLSTWLEAAPTGRWELEIPFRRWDGDVRWHLAKARAIQDETSGIVRWIGIAVDVHERKLAEEALRTSEEKYRQLFESMDEGYCVIEMLFDDDQKPVDWRFIETNAAFNEQNPIPGMAFGKRMTELVPGIEPKWSEIYGRVALTGEAIRFTEHSDALHRWFDLYAFRVGDGDSRKVAVLFTNITERVKAESALRDSEERFRALVTASSTVIYRMTPDWSHAKEVDGQHFLIDTTEPRDNWIESYVPRQDHVIVWKEIRKAIHEKSMFQLEHRVNRADGSLGWTLSRAVPLLDREGHISEWFGVATDVTERRLAEDALRKTEKLAVVGRLAATISHEINNPLEAVTNLLYLIQSETDMTTVQRYASTASEELSRVSHIVTHTLTFNRQSSHATEESLSVLLDSALAIYKGRIKVSGSEIITRYDSEDSVVCYPSELRQVFTNLIGNAFDATRLGGKLTLATRRRRNTRTGEDGVSVLIADTGHGMSAEVLKHLFEPFYTTKGINGTGLGLWVSKSILNQHQAVVRVKSSAVAGTNGTIWYLWLPRSR